MSLSFTECGDECGRGEPERYDREPATTARSRHISPVALACIDTCCSASTA